MPPVSDIHQLPLLGHDLPEVVPRHPALARVFKAGDHWTWTHKCSQSPKRAHGYAHASHPLAFVMAEEHMERCR